jgi:hypothetical protein
MRVLFSHIFNIFVSGGVLDGPILTDVTCNLIVVLICISFLARDLEHFSYAFLVIWTSSFENVVFSSDVHFFIGSLIFGEYSFLSSLPILVINQLSDAYLAKIFFHPGGHLFN